MGKKSQISTWKLGKHNSALILIVIYILFMLS